MKAHNPRISITLAASGLALAVLAASCASTPRSVRGPGANAGGFPGREAASEVKTAIADAMALSLAGQTGKALDRISEAMASTRDLAVRAGALEAKAWTMLLSGSRDAALEALREAAATGAPRGPGRAVLEFRLAATGSLDDARRLAAASMTGAADDERAATAIKVMLGDKDLRDVPLESPEAVSEYATYLAGYTLAPRSDPAAPTETADGPLPVVVVATPDSIGADEATMAIARLACRDALARRGRFSVVDGDSRKAAVEELELSLSDAAAGDKDRAIGVLFSADYVASGSVVKADSGWLVAYSLSSAADGRIMASDFSMAPDHAAILAAAARFAAALDGLPAEAR